MNIYTKPITVKSNVGLVQTCWAEINPDWESQIQPNGDAVCQKVCVGFGCDSPYEFPKEMRQLLEDEQAEVYSVQSGRRYGYFAISRTNFEGLSLGENKPQTGVAVFAIPEPPNPQPKSA